MAPNEQEIKNRLCPNCKVALLYDHPEDKFKILGWKKCIFCSYCEIQEKKLKEWTKLKKSQ